MCYGKQAIFSVHLYEEASENFGPTFSPLSRRLLFSPNFNFLYMPTSTCSDYLQQ